MTADNTEKAIRFGCGFIFGLIVGGIGTVSVFYANGYSFAAIVLGTGLVCALAALWFGNFFWRFAKLWYWW